MANRLSWGLRLFWLICLLLSSAWLAGEAPAQAVIDEAQQAGRSAQSFPAADEDYFRAMDGGIALTPDEVKGRNMWIVWTGGNDRLWDELTNLTFGIVRFPEDPVVLSRAQIQPRQPLEIFRAGQRAVLRQGRPARTRSATGCGSMCATPTARPIRSRTQRNIRAWRSARAARTSRPARTTASRPASSACGSSRIPISTRPRQRSGTPSATTTTRLLPVEGAGAARTASACRAASAMSARTREAAGRSRSAAVGESELDRRRAVLLGRPHLRLERRPVDLLLPVPAHLAARLARHLAGLDRQHQQSAHDERGLQSAGRGSRRPSAGARRRSAGGNLDNKQFNDFVSQGPLAQFFQPPNTVWTPHVLKDGADSVGALGALNRVYLNIGLFSEEWLLHFNPILGGKPITPIEITTARANSAYWEATELQTPDMALFLLKASDPHKLKNAPGGAAYLNDPPDAVQPGQGRVRRELRALPLEQGAAAAGRAPTRRAASAPAISTAGTATGNGPRPTISSSRCGRSSMPTISSTTTTCRTTCGCR